MRSYISEYKKNLSIAIPVALSQLGHIAVNVGDTVMVGKLGGVPLASITLALSVMIPFMMFGIGISYGVSPLIAKAEGEENHQETGSLLKNSIVVNGITGLFFSALLMSCAFLMKYLKQPPEVVEVAVSCFQILAANLLPLMIFQTFRQFAEGLGKTKGALVVSIAGNIFNLVLNYCLVFGKAGFPRMEAYGSATATLISRVLMALFMFLIIWYNPVFKPYLREFRKAVVNRQKVWYLLKMSVPVGFQLSLEAGAFGFAAIIVGWLGTKEIAAHQIALNLAGITYMAATGISSATTVRVGNGLGKGSYAAMRRSGFAGMHIVLVFMSLTALAFILFRFQLPSFYIDDPEIRKMAAGLLLIAAVFQLSDGMQVVAIGALRGLGDVAVPTAIAIIAYWIIGLPAGCFFAFVLDLKIEGVWYGLLMGLTTAALLLFIRFYSKSKEAGNFPEKT